MLEIKTIHNIKIAELQTDHTVIHETDDALDLMGNASYQGAKGIIIKAVNLCPEFYDLSTGIAGNILQKFSNYRMKLAVVGDFGKYASKSLKDFIRESNRSGHICFVSSNDEAISHLTS